MKKMLACFVLSLIGCVSMRPHDWVILDYDTNQCYLLPSSSLDIDGQVKWRMINDQYFHTSEHFDVKVVYGEDYESAANSLGIDQSSRCRSGLMP